MQERSTREGQTGKNDERGLAPAPVPADVGIVAAMSMEVGDLLSGLKKVYKYRSVAVPVIEGEYAGKIVAVAVGGMGRAAAARAADVLIAGHRPRWLLSAGFAGALNPAYSRNDLILAREVSIVKAARSCRRPRPRWQRASSMPGAGCSPSISCHARRRKGRIASPVPGRPGRHGKFGRGGCLPRKASAFPVDPGDQRRCSRGPTARIAAIMNPSGVSGSVRPCAASGSDLRV